MCPASSGDYSKKGKLFLEMLNEYLDQIRAPSSEHRVLLRCDVNFDISLQRRNLNTLIGRAAHIEFLETDIFAKFIMWSFPELFRWFTDGHLSSWIQSLRAHELYSAPSDLHFFIRGSKCHRLLGMAWCGSPTTRCGPPCLSLAGTSSVYGVVSSRDPSQMYLNINLAWLIKTFCLEVI